jgi:hypothetical protein
LHGVDTWSKANSHLLLVKDSVVVLKEGETEDPHVNTWVTDELEGAPTALVSLPMDVALTRQFVRFFVDLEEEVWEHVSLLLRALALWNNTPLEFDSSPSFEKVD